MWAPSLAHILTRLVTGEGWKNLGLRLNLRKGWPFWLAAWFLPGLLTLQARRSFSCSSPNILKPLFRK